MNILMAHNLYQNSGGEDISFRMEVEMLRRSGCGVETLIADNEKVDELGRLRTAVGSIWSTDTYRRTRAVLRRRHFDVLHVQNFFPLISPSIYYAARAEGVPVVQSLRNYRLLCPTGTFNRNGHVCEDCVGRLMSWPAIRHACYRNSRLGSAAVSGMLAVHRGLGTWHHMVDAYIAMTDFMRDKFVLSSFPAEKMFVKPNFLYPDPLPGDGNGSFALYVGRLTEEKGIDTMLKAWALAAPEIPLKVVGTGPMKSRFLGETHLRSVEYLGWRPEHEVLRLMGLARFILIPTEWYEGHPRTAVEAFARSLPVIASRIGATAEMIEDGVSGLLSAPGNAADLARKIRWALTHPRQMVEMGARGRAVYERKYTANRNYPRLMEIYQHAIAARHAYVLRPVA